MTTLRNRVNELELRVEHQGDLIREFIRLSGYTIVWKIPDNRSFDLVKVHKEKASKS